MEIRTKHLYPKHAKTCNHVYKLDIFGFKGRDRDNEFRNRVDSEGNELSRYTA